MHSGTGQPDNPKRRANLRVALTLASIAVVFFGGIIAAQYAGSASAGIGVLGLAIVGFLVAVIGRGIRR